MTTLIVGIDPGLSKITEGLIHCGGDKYRKPYTRKNGRAASYYFYLVKCSECGKHHLQHAANKRKYANSFCSKKCSAKGKSGEQNHGWGGGRKKKSSGHILVYAPDHPNAVKNFVPEHRMIVENAIGRVLRRDEFVHHINCDKADNRLENLVVLDSYTHNTAHGSIESCVPELFAIGVLEFDRSTNRYIVKKANRNG